MLSGTAKQYYLSIVLIPNWNGLNKSISIILETTNIADKYS